MTGRWVSMIVKQEIKSAQIQKLSVDTTQNEEEMHLTKAGEKLAVLLLLNHVR